MTRTPHQRDHTCRVGTLCNLLVPLYGGLWISPFAILTRRSVTGKLLYLYGAGRSRAGGKACPSTELALMRSLDHLQDGPAGL